jgi:DNA mismatch endonuclease (patch repair protein)
MSGQSIRARAPLASSPKVHRVMAANYGDNTNPERLLRSALFRLGLRFRRNTRPVSSLRCSADIVFPRQRLCIFVDGCFWHGCRKHFECPKKNRAWWKEKIEANRVRDRMQTRTLKEAGWKVVRIWEHDITSIRIAHVSDRLRKIVSSL